LSTGNMVTVTLSAPDDWTLESPPGGAYDGEVPGTYVYQVPLLMPEIDDTPYFTNPDGLKAEVQIQVQEPDPMITLVAPLSSVIVEYGTPWDDIDDLPILAIVESSDGTLGSASLAASSEWTLISAPDGDSYDGHTAGEYIFHAPLVMPEEEPYFINPDGLQAKVTVLVEEAPPALNWSVLFDWV